MKTMNFAVVALCCALAGCFTISETDYPQVETQRLPDGRDVHVQLSGFDASVTTYVPVYGYETVVGYSGHRRHGYYYPTTVSTTAFLPQVSADRTFVGRATELLEKSGFILQTTTPQYRIDVKFVGPYVSGADTMKDIAWSVFSLFTAGYAVQNWSAKLKVYDTKSGKLLFDHDYQQEYEVLVWGPIPLFSPGASPQLDANAMQSWALTALTDRAIADAISYLSSVVVK